MTSIKTVRARRNGTTSRRSQVIAVAVLSIFVLAGLFPYLFMIGTSLKSNEQFYDNFWGLSWPIQLSNYATAWQQVYPYLLTSIVVALVAIVGTVALASVAAFVFARYDFIGRKFLFGFVAVLLMIPNITSIIPLFVLVRNLGLLNTHLVLVIPHLTSSTVLAVVIMRTFFQSAPQDLFDAARVDGASAPRIYASIMMPLSLPIIGTVALTTVIGVWNDFFWPLLTITDNSLRTVPVGLSFFKGQNLTDWGPLFAGYTISSIPLLILFIFLSKRFLAGVQGGISGAEK